ncbi:HlyD family efflux transporter periplasmic adaptor subunit [Marinilabiliaceae bacterium JC017]|nr:HlyD family efflux transporter periplasmic adaptor subunit [Marinilabiliaceae bacterium JC017]
MKRIIYMLGLTMFLAACNNNSEESDAYGNFEATEVLVSAEVNGRSLRLTAEEGDVINKGAVICVIDTVPLTIKRDQLGASKLAALSKLNQVKAQIAVLKAQKKVAQKDFNRIEKMHNDGAATARQFDEAEGQLTVMDRQLDSYHTQIKSVRAEVAVVERQIEEVLDQLSRCEVKMPIQGTVLQKFSEEGELIAGGKPIIKVADLERMYLRAYVSGKQLPQLKLGQKVKVLFDKDASTNQSIDGVVSWISSSAEFTPKIIQTKEERVDLVYAVKVKIQNDGRVKIGMPGEVKF